MSVSTTAKGSFGAGLLLGVIGALAAGAHGAWRSELPFYPSWLALSASTALLTAPAGALLRASRPWPDWFRNLVLALMIAVGPWTILGRLLKAGTHHRPLGAVTFSVLAVVIGVVLVVLVSRLASWSAQRGARMFSGTILFLGLLGVTCVLVVTLPLASTSTLPSVLDATLMVGVFLAAAALPFHKGWLRVARFAGPSLWAFILLVGGIVLVSGPNLAVQLSTRAPVLTWTGDLLRY